MNDPIESTCGRCEQCRAGYSATPAEDEAVRRAFGASLCPRCHDEAHAVFMLRCELTRTVQEMFRR